MKKISMAGRVAVAILAATALLYAASTIPAGTAIIVTTDTAITTKSIKAGDTISGSVAQDVQVSGKTIIPKGSRATITVVAAEASGRLSNPAKLQMRVTSIEVRGVKYNVATNVWSQTGPSHNKRNVVAIGGGTAAGAVIGAIAGGGKGAAIGAAVGAGAGTAGAAATGKKDIEFPPESQLRFTTRSAVTIK
jgi:hypothetical protein